MSDYIKPTSDMFVKYLFGTENNKELLISFINAVLADSDSDLPLIESVELKSPFNIKEFVMDKESILDLKAIDDKGRFYDIEVQSAGNDHFKNRSLYYWSKLYSSQLENSQFYTELRPAICINLLDFNLFGDETPLHNCFVLRELKNPELILTDNLLIHFLELPKLGEQISNNKLKNWIEYFKKEGRMEDMKTLLESDLDIRKAHNVYKEFSGNSQYREVYEARLKWQKDYEGRLNYEQKKAREEGLEEGMEKGMEKGIEKGREEGMEKGMEKGELKGKKETAKELLKLNMSIELVEKATGLTHEVIKGLKAEL